MVGQPGPIFQLQFLLRQPQISLWGLAGLAPGAGYEGNVIENWAQAGQPSKNLWKYFKKKN